MWGNTCCLSKSSNTRDEAAQQSRHAMEVLSKQRQSREFELCRRKQRQNRELKLCRRQQNCMDKRCIKPAGGHNCITELRQGNALTHRNYKQAVSTQQGKQVLIAVHCTETRQGTGGSTPNEPLNSDHFVRGLTLINARSKVQTTNRCSHEHHRCLPG